MKTGILTFHSAHHYGAQLQAYALMKAVERMGSDCEIIDYVRIDTIEGNNLFKKGFSQRQLLSNVHTLLHYGQLKKRYDRFENFKRNEMNLTDRLYTSYAELSSDAPVYDVYVCGSDQIWNPLIYKERTFDPAFFAAFAKKGRRVSYAASFGISQIPDENVNDLKYYLSGFDMLSVREKQGEKIIGDLTGRGSVTVLDPTLLLTKEEWKGVFSQEYYHQPYILCYFISDTSKYAGFVEAASRAYNLPVVSLCGARRVVPSTRYSVLDAGPREFLSLFFNAALVFTDSFHGTAFSINFEKDFYSFVKAVDAEKASNSRIYNILDQMALSGRILTAKSDLKAFEATLRKSVDYSEVIPRLSVQRELSLNYLKEAVMGLKSDKSLVT